MEFMGEYNASIKPPLKYFIRYILSVLYLLLIGNISSLAPLSVVTHKVNCALLVITRNI